MQPVPRQNPHIKPYTVVPGNTYAQMHNGSMFRMKLLLTWLESPDLL